MNLFIKNLIPYSLILSLALYGCGKKEEAAPQAPRKVQTITTQEPSNTIARSFSGQLSTAEGVSLAFEVTGRVISVSAKQGQEYPAGAILARLDQSDYQNNLDTAQANATQAKQELRRLQLLFTSGNASQSQVDSADASALSAQANLNQNTKRLDDTVLRMPYKGNISSVNVDNQQVVGAGESVMTVQGEGPMEFKFGVPTAIVRQLRNEMKIQIRLGDIENKSFPARITEISPGIESNTTYGVTSALDANDPFFRAGMDGEATIELPRSGSNTIEIPLTCVLASADGAKYVWIAQPQDGARSAKVVKRNVTLGMLEKEGTVSVTSGLASGERVISRGVHRVTEGMTVTLSDS